MLRVSSVNCTMFYFLAPLNGQSVHILKQGPRTSTAISVATKKDGLDIAVPRSASDAFVISTADRLSHQFDRGFSEEIMTQVPGNSAYHLCYTRVPSLFVLAV